MYVFIAPMGKRNFYETKFDVKIQKLYFRIFACLHRCIKCCIKCCIDSSDFNP